ncbi:MAG: Ig-like domain-containing protein [Lachnospiraceae bacterium]|nr:Ig-like domain-containing protein [Lachnospiraceae bacterium]
MAKKVLCLIMLSFAIISNSISVKADTLSDHSPIISLSFYCNSDFYDQPTQTNTSVIAENFFPGMRHQVFATVLFASIDDLIWSSSNPEIATVSPSGLVTAVSPGITTISASFNGIISTLDVVISNPDEFMNSTIRYTPEDEHDITGIKEYDKYGLLKKHTIIEQYSDTVISYSYTKDGYLKSITWYYNSLGRDNYVEYPQPASYKVFYNTNHSVRKVKYIDSEYGEVTKYTYEYDQSGRTIKKRVYGTLEGEPTHLLVSRRFYYDKNGLMIKEKRIDYNSFSEKYISKIHLYLYDDDGNLIDTKTRKVF